MKVKQIIWTLDPPLSNNYYGRIEGNETILFSLSIFVNADEGKSCRLWSNIESKNTFYLNKWNFPHPLIADGDNLDELKIKAQEFLDEYVLSFLVIE